MSRWVVLLPVILACQHGETPVASAVVALPPVSVSAPSSTSSATPAIATMDAGADVTADVAVSTFELAARFGQTEWGFEGDSVVVRTSDHSTRFTPPEGSMITVINDADGPSCAFLDATHAWCVVLGGEWPKRTLRVARSADGGASWSSAHLAGPGFTDWPLQPTASLSFRDASHGTATVVDPPQHHNLHRQRTWTYATSDGGKTWSLLHADSKCVDPVEHCLHV